MSGATYILKSALNKILDGYIWQFLGLPVFTIFIPGVINIFKNISKKIYTFFKNEDKKYNKKNKNINIFKKINYKLARKTVSCSLLIFMSFRLLQVSPLSRKIKTNLIKTEIQPEKEIVKKNEKLDSLLKFIKDLKLKIFRYLLEDEK
jgi:predicted RND superfamily exporter protein